MTAGESLFVERSTLQIQSNDFNNSPLPDYNGMNSSTYPMMIRLIEGSLDGIDNLQSLYNKNTTSNDDDLNPIPTIASVAVKALQEEGTKLDEKQIVTYETICSTFLLQLVNEGVDDSTSMGSYFANAAESLSSKYSTNSQRDISCEDSLSSMDCSLSINSTNSDFGDGSHSYSLLSQSQISSTRSDFSSLQSPNDDSDQCSHVSVSSMAPHQTDYSLSSVTSNQLEFSSPDSTRNMEDNSFGLDHQTYASESTRSGTCDGNRSFSSDSAFTSNEDKSHQQVSIRNKLYGLGAKKQLIMFLTGSAGAGKTTAVKLAQKFCFEFCRAVRILWNNKTFLFTAYTGSAVSFCGGVTIYKAAFLNKQNSTLDEDDIHAWKDVRILVIDEISFMKDSEMIRLDKRLKQCSGDRMKPFGGYSIIFAGDFRQLEPIGAKPEQLLFAKETSHAWCDLLNAVVILESHHRFKEDPEYRELLQRMWAGDLSKKIVS